MKFALALIALLMPNLLVAANPQTSGYAKLSSMYQYAQKHSLNFLQAQSNWQVARESITTARSNLLPSIQAQVNYSELETGIDGSTAIQSFTPIGDSQQLRGQVTLNQPIYNHGAWAGYKAAKQRTQSAKHTFGNAHQLLILELSEAYFNVLLKQEEVKLSKAKHEALSRQYEDTKNQFEIGNIAESPMLEAQAASDLAYADTIVSENQLAQAQTQLMLITNQQFSPAPLRAVQLNSLELAPIEEWTTLALAQNHNLLASKESLSSKNSEISARRAQHFPSLDLQLSHDYADQSGYEVNAVPLDDYTREDTRASINLTIPIYSGGATTSDVRSTIAERDYLKQQVTNLTVQVTHDSRQTYQDVLAARAQMSALANAQKSASLAYKNIQFEHEEGLRPLSDVLSSRQNLFQAQVQLAQGKYRYLTAYLQLHAIAGQLNLQTLAALDHLFE